MSDEPTMEELTQQMQVEQRKRESRALTAWSNAFLQKRKMEVNDLQSDFADGVLLINLLEASFDKRVGSYTLRPKLPIQRLENVTIALKFMESLNINLVSIDSNAIVKKDEKALIVTLWNILRVLTLRGIGGDHTSSGKENMRDALLKWANEALGDALGFAINDFWQSFKSGVAFCSIVEHLCPGNIDVPGLDPSESSKNLKLAFDTAESELGIPALLSPEDFEDDKKPNEKAVMNYVCMLVSAAKGLKGQVQQMSEMKKKMEAAKAKKEEEVRALREQMEREKQQFEETQANLAKMKQMQEAAAEREKNLKADAEQTAAEVEAERMAAAEEKKMMRDTLTSLTKEIERTRGMLLETFDKEKLLREENDALRQQLLEKDEIIAERDATITELNAELYSMHREFQTVVENFRNQMNASGKNEKVGMLEEQQRGMLETLLSDSILEQKSRNDFINMFTVREGWLMKRDPGALVMKKFHKRYFRLKGETLSWGEDGSKMHGKISLTHYQFIARAAPTPADDGGAKKLTQKDRRRRGSVMATDKKSGSLVIELCPRESEKKGNKMIELMGMQTMLEEHKQDIGEWVDEINTRIALLNYLDIMFSAKGKTKGVREFIEFMSDRKATDLCISNKVCDIHQALTIFKEPLCYRRGLNISFVNVALTDPSVAILAQIIAKNPTCESVELGLNLITESGAGALADAMHRNRSLKVIDLSNNTIKDEGVIKLAQAVTTHRKLRTLNVAGNQITDIGAAALVAGLLDSQEKHKNEPHKFRSINLSKNLVGDEACMAIKSLLEQNNMVRQLHLDNNNITDAGVELLCQPIADGHCMITELNLSGNQLSSKGVHHVAQMMKDTDHEMAINLSKNPLVGRKGVQEVMKMKSALEFQSLSFVRKEATVVEMDPAAASTGRNKRRNSSFKRPRLSVMKKAHEAKELAAIVAGNEGDEAEAEAETEKPRMSITVDAPEKKKKPVPDDVKVVEADEDEESDDDFIKGRKERRKSSSDEDDDDDDEE